LLTAATGTVGSPVAGTLAERDSRAAQARRGFGCRAVFMENFSEQHWAIALS
jgi:hypothetical protein